MKYFLILLFTVCTLTTQSQTSSIKNSPSLSEASAAEVGMSDERLARVDNMLANAIDKNEVPGAVALIARNGKIVYYKAFGMANNKSKRSLKRDDIFRIASQTLGPNNKILLF